MVRRLRTAELAAVAAFVSMLVVTSSACSGSDGASVQGARGAEGGPCPGAGVSCDVGLVCLSNLCVQPPDGNATSSSSSGGASGSSGNPADASTDAPSAFDAAACTFKHPLVDADLRFCSAGDCYCKGADSCYPKSIAAACCGGGEGTCN